MRIKRLLSPKLLSDVMEKVHERNLPIEINAGEERDGLVDVLFEFPDTFQCKFEPLMDGAFNEVFGPLEGGYEL